MTHYFKSTGLVFVSLSILFAVYYIQPRENIPFTTTPVDCSCINMSYIEHGEHQPVIVPEITPALSPELQRKIKVNRLASDDLLMTIAGYNDRFELYNWIAFIKAAQETQFLIFCTDKALYQHLTIAGYQDQATVAEQDTSLILQQLVYLDINPLMLDIHQLVLQPRTIEYLSTMMHVRWDTQLIAAHDGSSTVHNGLIYLMRDSYPVKRLMAHTVQIQARDPDISLQQAFYQALDQFPIDVKTGFTLLLDIVHFPDGESYFTKELSKNVRIEPYMVYVDHKVGRDRVELLKEHDMWKADEEYIEQLDVQINPV